LFLHVVVKKKAKLCQMARFWFVSKNCRRAKSNPALQEF
jgi:hypothetical protein